MKKTFRLISSWYRSIQEVVKPTNYEVKGASWGVWIITILIWLLTTISLLLKVKDVYIITLFVILIGLPIIASRLLSFFIKKIHLLPQNYKLSIFAVLPVLLVSFSFSYILAFVIIIFSSIIGSSILGLRKNNFKKYSTVQKTIRVSGLTIGILGISILIILWSIDGFESIPIRNSEMKVKDVIHLTAKNPSEFGSYDVEILYYGSGKDKHRPEFYKDVDIKTDSVDATAFIDNWKGFGGWYRTRYWGFDEKALPLNGRVWYPKGQGKFPLVLVVHGNHSMQDFSDPGYDYLGKLIASRGFIMASVDENFLNSSWTDLLGGLKSENDARAWLLLEHLKLWHIWNKDSTNVFYNKIDTNNIALIGHSRGGEAVAHAACFNKIPYYPDDADIKLGYNFNIRSIIAIAPVDGQYRPANNKTSLKDINYFVLHGAHDSDASSFMGAQQYERVNFSNNKYHFKAGLYIYGANHGQFNTTWGINDCEATFDQLLNLKQIMNGEEQRKIAKVYISAFLESTLKQNYSYLPLFMDYRTGKDWLPKTIYLNQFQDSKSEFICTFDEDINITSSTDNYALLSAKNLTVWKEKLVDLKWGNKGTRAVYLGWNNKKDSNKIPSYSIDLSNNKIKTDSSSILIFSMADADEDSNPKSHGKWISQKKEDFKNIKKEEKKSNKKEKDKGKEPIDFTIAMEDNQGNKIKFPLSSYSYLQPKLKVMLMKTDFINDKIQSENVFQLFKFPFNKLIDNKSDFNFRNIRSISFIFNKTKNGVVIIDNIGFMKELKSKQITL